MPTAPGTPPDVPAVLTVREQEVLGLLAAGMDVHGIATQLGLSVRTAKQYRAQIIDKLGLRGDEDLRDYALRHLAVGGGTQAPPTTAVQLSLPFPPIRPQRGRKKPV